jgi:hypothetical protein
MGLGSSCHSGSRLAGEYCVILLSNELFDGHICLLECNLAANCYSPMPHMSPIFPISDVACRGAHHEVIIQVSDIDCAAADWGTSRGRQVHGLQGHAMQLEVPQMHLRSL